MTVALAFSDLHGAPAAIFCAENAESGIKEVTKARRAAISIDLFLEMDLFAGLMRGLWRGYFCL